MFGNISLIYVASPLHDPRKTSHLISAFKEAIGGLGTDLIESGLVTTSDEVNGLGLKGDELALILPITGGTEALIAAIAGRSKHSIILYHEKMNSLAATLEAISYLKYSGIPATLLPLTKEGLEKLRSAVTAWIGLHKIPKKMALIGEPSPWLIYSSGPEIERFMSEELGIVIERIPLAEVYGEFDNIREDVMELAEKVMKQASFMNVEIQDLIKALKLYEAIKRVLNHHNIEAFTIRCFDVINSLGTTACLPLSLLNSEGFIAGCEGDLPALLSLAIAKALTGKPGFMGNVADIKGKDIILTHCTAPISVLQSYGLKTHYESGIGVGVEGKLPEGETITLLRVDPLSASMRVNKGVILRSGSLIEEGCRTQVLIRLEEGTKGMLKEFIGNHHVMMFGDHVNELERIAEYLDLGVIH